MLLVGNRGVCTCIRSRCPRPVAARGCRALSCRLTFTLEAAATRGERAPERRETRDRGLDALVKDPYRRASTHVGTDEDDRRARVVPGIRIEYVIVRGLMVIVVIEIFDEAVYVPG